MGPEHWRAREQRLDRHQAERLVPRGRVPQAPGAREQCRFRAAVDFTHELDRPRETGPPAARDDQTMAGALRGLHRPVIALGAVQRSQEQVVLRRTPGKAPEDIVGGVEAVVDEDRRCCGAARGRARGKCCWETGQCRPSSCGWIVCTKGNAPGPRRSRKCACRISASRGCTARASWDRPAYEEALRRRPLRGLACWVARAASRGDRAPRARAPAPRRRVAGRRNPSPGAAAGTRRRCAWPK